ARKPEVERLADPFDHAGVGRCHAAALTSRERLCCMKAHHDRKLPEDLLFAGGSLERGGPVDHDRNARSFTELEPGGLRHGASEGGHRDHDSDTVEVDPSCDALRIELPAARIDVRDP